MMTNKALERSNRIEKRLEKRASFPDKGRVSLFMGATLALDAARLPPAVFTEPLLQPW